MNGFINSYDHGSFLLYLIIRACNQRFLEAILDPPNVEMLLEYIYPSGNGKEPKSRK